MNNIALRKYIQMFELLDLETKLELLAKLTDNINRTFKKPKRDKTELLDSLCGSWDDIDDAIIDEIYNSRTTSNREIELD